jgi:hypothetical protein
MPKEKMSGRATLAHGVARVSAPWVTADSNILLTSQSEGVSGVLLAPVTRRVAGEGFEIQSTNGGDAGPVAWEVIGDE